MTRPDAPGPADTGAGGPGAPEAGCGRCGTRAPGPPLTWSTATGPRGTTWLCDACTRDHVRSIEGRLDETWW